MIIRAFELCLQLLCFPAFLIVNIYLAWRRTMMFKAVGWVNYEKFFTWYLEGIIEYWDPNG